MVDYRQGLNGALAAELRAERARVGITVEEFARRSGVPRGSLQRYLNAQRPICVDRLEVMAAGLGVGPEVLVTRAARALTER